MFDGPFGKYPFIITSIDHELQDLWNVFFSVEVEGSLVKRAYMTLRQMDDDVAEEL